MLYCCTFDVDLMQTNLSIALNHIMLTQQTIMLVDLFTLFIAIIKLHGFFHTPCVMHYDVRTESKIFNFRDFQIASTFFIVNILRLIIVSDGNVIAV